MVARSVSRGAKIGRIPMTGTLMELPESALRRVKFEGGYAALPSTGPAGETCGSCRFLYRRQMSNTYLKCDLMRHLWTGGAGSDIKAKAPACRRWARV